MKFISAFVLFLSIIASCKQHDMEMEDLQKVKWDSLVMGIANISTKNEKGIAGKTDSIAFKLKGVSGKDIYEGFVPDSNLAGMFNAELAGALATKAPDSKAGYLRLNLNELMMNDLVVRVHLKGGYGSDNNGFRKDSAILAVMPGVRQVAYVSQKETLKKYFGDTSKVWPFGMSIPSGIELTLQAKKWTKEEMESLKNSILDKISIASDVSYPAEIFDGPDKLYFFQYKRIKK